MQQRGTDSPRILHDRSEWISRELLPRIGQTADCPYRGFKPYEPQRNRMNRRTVLGLVGSVTSGFAGCLATGASDRAPDSTATTPPATPSGTPPVNTGVRRVFDPAATYKQVEVGSRADVNEDFLPHNLYIGNATPGQRVVNLRILDRVANETVHRATYPIPANNELTVTLLEPSRYFVQLWGPAINTETLLVPCSLFDCNTTSTGIHIYEDGHIGSSVASTLVACPAPDC